MGWSVYVDEAVIYVPRCAEVGCTWEVDPTFDRRAAERLVAEHRASHAEAWAKQNEEWEQER